MRKTITSLLVLLSMLLFFSGCVSGRIYERIPSFSNKAAPLPLRHYYPDLGFSLDFPENWAEHLTVQRDRHSIIVSIDGNPTYSFVSVKNEPGAKELDIELTEAGYTYYRQNGTHFFYYKTIDVLPEKLYMGSQGNKDPEKQTNVAMYACWQIDLDNDICQVVVDEDDYYLSMKTEDYVNYRLGISVTLPKSMLKQGSVYLRPNAYECESYINLVLREESPLISGRFDDYILCSIIAIPASDPYQGSFNLIDSPDLLYLDGKLYGVVNEWRNSIWRSYTQVYYGWERYPEHIRETFSFEDVQQVVGSFKLL